VFEDPPGHTGILAGNWHVNPRMIGKPRLRAARCANDRRHRSMWGEYMPDSVLFEGQNAVFRLPTSHTGFLAGNLLWTHVCSESPDCELQDAPMISAIGAYGGSICPIQCCLRVKTPHFDGLVRAPLTGPRINMATNICLESTLYFVSENTIKSGIRLILGSWHHFWSKRCDFCGVRQLARSQFLMHWKALNNLHN